MNFKLFLNYYYCHKIVTRKKKKKKHKTKQIIGVFGVFKVNLEVLSVINKSAWNGIV